MSDFTPAVSWSGKDALADSDPDKIISGDDFNTEFSGVQTAVNSKYDSTDLGVTLQQYDADTAKLDVAQTWTAEQVVKLKDTSETTVAKGNFGATPAWDVSAGNAQWGTVDQAITSSTMTNWPASGATGYLALEVINGAAFAIVWPTSVDWVGGTAPTLTASGTDQLVFRSRDGGTTVLGWVAGLDIK
jgi:hypothetical protein